MYAGIKHTIQRIRVHTVRFHSIVSTQNEVTGLFQYTKLTQKTYLKIRGPDTIEFLNGMITTKMKPYFVKKNLMTINDHDKSQIKGSSIIDFPTDKSNWGLYQENGPYGEHIIRFGQYTGFLNGKGKLITDSIFYCTPVVTNGLKMKYPEYLVEFDKEIIPYMLKVLESHKLASKIKFEHISNLNCWDVMIGFRNIPKDAENPWIDNLLDPMSQMKTPEDADLFSENVINTLFKSNNDILGGYIDRRYEPLLYKDGSTPAHFRFVTKDTVSDIGTIFNTSMMPFPMEIKKHEDNSPFFRRERLKYGFLDGVKDVKSTTLLPLECNFDYLPNAISKNKGCYVGQELTARTISTGILRKRIVSVVLDDPTPLSELLNSSDFDLSRELVDVELSEKYYDNNNNKNNNTASETNTVLNPFSKSNATVTKRRKRPVGTLIAFEGDMGIVLLRTEYFPLAFNKYPGADDMFYLITPSGKRVNIKIKTPYWYDTWSANQKYR